MTLAELIGPDASNPGEVAGYWQAVQEWSLGGNDMVGDCVFCTAANYTDLIEAVNGDPQLVPEAEVEHWYAWETGWRRDNPASDKGEVLEKMLQTWRNEGNPSDPVDRLTDYCAIEPDQIHQAVHSLGAVPAWCMLPAAEDGTWDFGDQSWDEKVAGTGPHAVLIVGSGRHATKDSESCFWLISWAEVKLVSYDWWRAYGRGQFAVRHPAWQVR